MVAGLPGTGIGGLFYVLSALLTPVRAALRRVSARRDLVEALGLAAMAGAVAAAIWLTGWGLGVLVQHVAPHLVASAGPTGAVVHPSNLIRTISLLLALVTLGLVIALVELARLAVQRPAAPAGRREPMPLKRVSRRRRKAA